MSTLMMSALAGESVVLLGGFTLEPKNLCLKKKKRGQTVAKVVCVEAGREGGSVFTGH